MRNKYFIVPVNHIGRLENFVWGMREKNKVKSYSGWLTLLPGLECTSVTDIKGTCWHKDLFCHTCCVCSYQAFHANDFLSLLILWKGGHFNSFVCSAKTQMPLLFDYVFHTWREDSRRCISFSFSCMGVPFFLQPVKTISNPVLLKNNPVFWLLDPLGICDKTDKIMWKNKKAFFIKATCWTC